MPFRAGSFDGVICVEAAFHFPSRAAFFSEAFRVLRPGGVLVMSDVPIRRMPRTPREAVAAIAMLRAWGLRRTAAATARDVVQLTSGAGFVDARAELVGDRVIAPALRFVRGRLERQRRSSGASRSYVRAAGIMVAQAQLLWERSIVDYLLLRVRKPDGPAAIGG